MSSSRKNRIERRKRAREEKKRLEQEQLKKEQELEAEGEANVEEPEEVEELEKHFVGEVAVHSVGGPTSWEEMEAQKDAEEKASKIRMKSYHVEDLVYNIVNHPDLTPQEKGNKIKAAGEGFSDRVTAIMDTPIQKDLDTELLSLEALIAQDERNTNLTDNVVDFIAKKKLTSTARKKLPDSAFALPSKRKYPIHDKAHVRNALARAAQQIKKGGDAAKDARAALPKIRAAAKKMGIGVDMKKDHNAVIVEKDANGDYRAVMWVSNNFIDWDGDIISKEAHEEYCEWLDANPDMAPAFLSWHIPETVRKNRVDFWTFENGFLLMSAKLEEEEAQHLLKAQTQTDLGMSHGSMVLARDPEDPRVITKYRMYEVSDLPLSKAANPFTDFETLVKEVGMDKLEYLTEILGSEEKAQAYMQKAGAKQEELRAAEIEEKEKTEEPVTEPEAEETEEVAEIPEYAAMLEKIKKDLDIPGLSEAFTKLVAQAEKVEVLEELVKSLQTDQDEELAEKIAPKGAFPWSQTASQKEDNVIEKEKEKEITPPGIPDGDDYWLSQQLGVPPIPAETSQ